MCPNCGSTVSDTDHFCESCGSALTLGGEQPRTLVCHCPPGQSQPDEEGYCQVCGVLCTSPSASRTQEALTKLHFEESPDRNLAIVSDVGKRHHENQDSGAVARGQNDIAALVVADGVSSSLNAAGASAVATKVIKEMLTSCSNPEEASTAMRRAIEAAHEAVISLPVPKTGPPDMDGPETTVVAALMMERRLTVGWVGDSRAYLFDMANDYAEEKLTVDDSWMEEVVRSGQMTEEQARVDRRAHYILQVLGQTDDPVEIHILEREMDKDEMLLLCSDGLWNYFQETGSLAKALRGQGTDVSAIEICKHLVDLANALGGHDNITVAILK